MSVYSQHFFSARKIWTMIIKLWMHGKLCWNYVKTDEVDWMDLNILQEMIQRELRSKVCEDVSRCSVLSFPLTIHGGLHANFIILCFYACLVHPLVLLILPTIIMNEWMNWYFIAVEYRHWRMCFERLLQAFARWQPGILFDTAHPWIPLNW